MTLNRRLPHLYTAKFAPVAIIGLFLLTTSTSVYFSPVFQSSVVHAVTLDTEVIPADIPTSGDHDLDLIIFRAGEREGVDPRFIHAVIWQESKYQNEALSHAGAQGLMQLMPATARRFGCSDANDMADNVAAGTKYLAWLLKRFDGDVKLTLAGYNAGEGAVDKYKGVPPYDETQNYVRIISDRYGKTFHPILSPDQAKLAFNLIHTSISLGQ
jgi:soluble lytic murein transglycosylase-like protein